MLMRSHLGLEKSEELRLNYPTNHSTILETRNPLIDSMYVIKNQPLEGYPELNLLKNRPGRRYFEESGPNYPTRHFTILEPENVVQNGSRDFEALKLSNVRLGILLARIF